MWHNDDVVNYHPLLLPSTIYYYYYTSLSFNVCSFLPFLHMLGRVFKYALPLALLKSIGWIILYNLNIIYDTPKINKTMKDGADDCYVCWIAIVINYNVILKSSSSMCTNSVVLFWKILSGINWQISQIHFDSMVSFHWINLSSPPRSSTSTDIDTNDLRYFFSDDVTELTGRKFVQ